VENEENQTQVSLRFPQPLEIAKARFPHSHRPGAAWKSGKPQPGFPLSHLLFSYENQPRKETLAADRFAPAFRLIIQ
jgi:hypothetical protein